MACASPAGRYKDRAGNEFRSLNYGTGHNHWFLFVVVTSFIITFLWSCFYFLQLKDSINMKLPFSWLKVVSKGVALSLIRVSFCIVVYQIIKLLNTYFCNYFLSHTFYFFVKELYYTVVVTVLYILAWIVILAGFGHCAGIGICDARIAAGVSTVAKIQIRNIDISYY